MNGNISIGYMKYVKENGTASVVRTRDLTFPTVKYKLNRLKLGIIFNFTS